MKRFVLSALAIAQLACVSDKRGAEQSRAIDGARVDNGEFDAGTVGAAVKGFVFDMGSVRRWYRVYTTMARYAQEHPGYHAKFDLQLSAPLEEHLKLISADSVLSRTLVQQQMTPREFALLTVVVAIGRGVVQAVDSLGPSGRPVNMPREIEVFWRAHRSELDSLDASLQ